MSLFFFLCRFYRMCCVTLWHWNECLRNLRLKNIKIMSAFVTRAVCFVIFKTAVFAMEWVKPSVKSAFWGIIFFYEKIWFQSWKHLKWFVNIICFFVTLILIFLHLWFIIRQKVSEGVIRWLLKPQSGGLWRKVYGGGQMFSGMTNHSIDAKGRIVLPAKFREQLGETY